MSVTAFGQPKPKLSRGGWDVVLVILCDNGRSDSIQDSEGEQVHLELII